MHPDFSCRLRPTRVSVIGGEECHKSLLNNAFQVAIGQFEQIGSNESAIPNLCTAKRVREGAPLSRLLRGDGGGGGEAPVQRTVN